MIHMGRRRGEVGIGRSRLCSFLKISLPNRVVIEGIENKGLGRWGSDRTGSGERTNEARTNERTREARTGAHRELTPRDESIPTSRSVTPRHHHGTHNPSGIRCRSSSFPRRQSRRESPPLDPPRLFPKTTAALPEPKRPTHTSGRGSTSTATPGHDPGHPLNGLWRGALD